MQVTDIGTGCGEEILKITNMNFSIAMAQLRLNNVVTATLPFTTGHPEKH